jgi:Protein of unknown function (DUF4011)
LALRLLGRPPGRSAIAEVYPSLWRHGFEPEGHTGDQHDAFCIAAWLARADRDGTLGGFLKPGLSPAKRAGAEVEDWIFGGALVLRLGVVAPCLWEPRRWPPVRISYRNKWGGNKWLSDFEVSLLCQGAQGWGPMRMNTNVEALEELVRAKIENLRPKLLDLSRRNPLISTKLGPRSNSHLRAVDELPDVLFFKLNNGQEMTLVPLPPIEEDPRDEQTDSFQEALINTRLTNEAYIAAMEAIDRDADDFLERTRVLDRERTW